ncbi:MAG: hypothetical protein QOJ50_2890 [Cryptosporangiaceae bacterium]|jgi:hypothetical protein|nr:hypothetical protein [Cryptosporangiaceae bacterium]
MRTDPDAPPRARIPADVEAPDKLIGNFTARQVAILTVAAVIAYGLWRALGRLLPVPVTAVALVPIAGAAIVLALGRRDGLTLDAWFLAAIGYSRTAKRAVPAPEGIHAAPNWAPVARASDTGRPPAVLRLPARAITESGVIDTGDNAAVALVAATTVNIGLRTGEEQWALLDAYARWLNALTGPVQIVVSAQRVDLSTHTTRISDAAAALPHPALADAALGYADFLLGLAADRDPLWRTVTIACTATGPGAGAEAARRAEHTAAALTALGGETALLDGPAATAVLTAATDPYQHGDSSWPRTPPGQPVTSAERRQR